MLDWKRGHKGKEGFGAWQGSTRRRVWGWGGYQRHSPCDHAVVGPQQGWILRQVQLGDARVLQQRGHPFPRELVVVEEAAAQHRLPSQLLDRPAPPRQQGERG